MNHSQTQFWSVPSFELLQQLQTTPQGLMSDEVQQRLLRYGSNLLKPKKKSDALTLLIGQFKSPIILILIFAAGLSFWSSALLWYFILLQQKWQKGPFTKG